MSMYVFSGEFLTADEEFKLATLAQEGDLKARDRLVLASSRYALKVAKKYAGNNVDVEDLYEAAIMSLFVSAQSYKPSHKTRFVLYAAKGISQSVIRELNFQYHKLSMSQDDMGIVRDLGTALKSAGEENEDEVLKSVAEKNGATYERVRGVREFMKRPVLSVDSGFEKEEENSAISVPANFSTEDTALRNLDQEIICEMINSLPKKIERTVMSMLYGLNGYKPMTGEKVGKIFGKTKAWVSLINKKCINHIRKEIGADNLVA